MVTGQPVNGFDDMPQTDVGYLIVQIFTGARKNVFVLKGPAAGQRLKTDFQLKKSSGKWLRVMLNLTDGSWSAKIKQARCKFAVVEHGWDPEGQKTKTEIVELEKEKTKATINLLDDKVRPVAIA